MDGRADLRDQEAKQAVPDWSLITVTYNSARVLEAHWAHVQLPNGVEWIVVDNASKDDSVMIAQRLGARVVPLQRNIGFGAANNVGLGHSQATFVGFVNPDVRVEAADLPLLAQLADETRGLVSPQLVNPDGSPQPNGRGLPFLAYKVLGRLGGASDYRRLAPPCEDVSVVWFIGAAVLGRRDVMHSLGPWDERFFVYYEDSDLGLRAARVGVPRVVTGRARWIHSWARETSTLSWRAWRREFASMVKFYSRYPVLLSVTPRVTARRLNRIGWPCL